MIGLGQGLLGDIAYCLRVGVAVYGDIDEGRPAQRVTVPAGDGDGRGSAGRLENEAGDLRG